MASGKTDERPKMVSWYDPSQLKNTAIKTVISTVIGENADPRLVAASGTAGNFFDYSRALIEKDGDFEAPEEGPARGEIWIDYVSDVGDGWNSTYAVARSLARPAIDPPGAARPLKRGDLLIFGGDAVYPTANTDEYEKKLVEPYRLAFSGAAEIGRQTAGGEADLTTAPHVFALPGNHDWYDSLVAFQNIFCTAIFNNRIFAGGWRTRQKRSYFALKLPRKWWLLAVDLQLSHNIDVRQLEYFMAVIEKMDAGDRVILCVPEPYWVKAIKYQDLTDVFEKKEQSIEKLENELHQKKIEIKLYLAGDLHHYRRFEAGDGSRVQKITAGGGGAFLHPTHDFDFDRHHRNKAKGFALKKNYPAAGISRKLDWKNFGFILINPTFGILTAALYAVLAWMTHGEIAGDFSWKKAFDATLSRLINEPIALLIVVGTLLALVFFTDSNSKSYRRAAGTVHGLAHLGAIFVFGWLGYLLGAWLTARCRVENPAYVTLVWFLSVAAVSGAAGYFVGAVIMGLYLFVSLHIFGRHDNEAFSALRIEDYKNFLRLHIDRDGKLNIYPLKIEKVPREWIRVETENRGATYEPKIEIRPELIESIDPIS